MTASTESISTSDVVDENEPAWMRSAAVGPNGRSIREQYRALTPRIKTKEIQNVNANPSIISAPDKPNQTVEHLLTKINAPTESQEVLETSQRDVELSSQTTAQVPDQASTSEEVVVEPPTLSDVVRKIKGG